MWLLAAGVILAIWAVLAIMGNERDAEMQQVRARIEAERLARLTPPEPEPEETVIAEVAASPTQRGVPKPPATNPTAAKPGTTTKAAPANAKASKPTHSAPNSKPARKAA